MIRRIVTRRQQREKRDGVQSRRERGQSLLEFALSLPILLILLLALVVIAWVAFSYMSITSAARMGARWMLEYPWGPTQPIDPSYPSVDAEIQDHVRAAMPMLNTETPTTTITISPTATARVSGAQVVVTVNYIVDLPTIAIPYIIVPGELVLSQPFALQARSTMRLD